MKSLVVKIVLAVIVTFSTINIFTHVQANTFFDYESSLFSLSSDDVITQSSDDSLLEEDPNSSFSSDDVISNSSDDVISDSSDDSIQAGGDYQYWGYKETTDPNKTWTITLSKAVHSVSVIDPPIYVSNALGESVPVTVDVSGHTITVTPVESYNKGAVYSLWIPQSVASMEGELLPSLAKMDFIVK